jgi:hypothetical protein
VVRDHAEDRTVKGGGVATAAEFFAGGDGFGGHAA